MRHLRALWPATLAVLVASCAFPGSVKPTVKIGLAAPFEGLYRDLGYEVLHAVRLAVRQRNSAGGVNGRYLVELVALNDLNEPLEAAQLAREMAVDPGVLGVVGGWSPESLEAAGPEYERLGLALLSPRYEPELLAAKAANLVAATLGAQSSTVACSEHSWHMALGQAVVSALNRQNVPVNDLCAGGWTQWLEAASFDQTGSEHLLVLSADTPTSAEWVRLVRRAGYEGTILGGPMMGSPLVAAIAGDASEGTLFVSQLMPTSIDLDFVEGYEALSSGVPPGPLSTWAFQAASRLLDAIEEASADGSRPTRQGVVSALKAWSEAPAPVHVYRIEGGRPFTEMGY